jgi:pyruvate/2-oxoglutarate dehydrogenase complex dihydrolipoamide acyltransferase (E2) component
MPHEVTMPQLGMAQDAGKIVSWLKAPGDAVTKGDALFEVETDKATMEVEAQASGYLTHVTAPRARMCLWAGDCAHIRERG